jgi:hypothetical protein
MPLLCRQRRTVEAPPAAVGALSEQDHKSGLFKVAVAGQGFNIPEDGG